ncbi:MAG: phosphatidic acid phosphatase [Bacteroidota bacterium]
MKALHTWLILGLCGLIISCQPSVEKREYDPNLIHRLNRRLIETISEDNFPPPVASRIYAYANLAAYEAVQAADSGFLSASAFVQDWEAPLPPENAQWDQAMIQAFCEAARQLVYRDHMIDSIEEELLLSIGKLDKQTTAWAQELSSAIKARANRDGYGKTRKMPRYETKKLPSSWEATPPTYGEALEPYWYQLQPFVMDSTAQFRKTLDITFSERPASEFYTAAEEIKAIVDGATQKDIDIAVYWDCNPGPLKVDGHVMQVRKQNTPGGHWIGINQIACQQRGLSLIESSAIYAKLAMGIADGFMAAWDSKFTHDLIRPETYINRYIDADWRPKLESPLFPEYTSAHSLISGVAATILTEAHGEQFTFTDTTNVQFALPARTFDNFWQAAEEAANSRILGGIHYRFGCDTGLQQGRELGALVRDRVSLMP